MGATGNFVVAWQGSAGKCDDVYAQCYNANGIAQGGEFRVNADTGGWRTIPSVGMDASGNFVIAWYNQCQDGLDIYAKRYDASGMSLGDEFLVNTQLACWKYYPSVGMDASGNFVVAWCSLSRGGEGIYARCYDASGVPQGSEFQVSTEGISSESALSLGMGSSGNFVVAWPINKHDGNGWNVFARRFTVDADSPAAEGRYGAVRRIGGTG